MSFAKRLLLAYSNFIGTPWGDQLAPSQRVIFCVYDPAEELKVRAAIGEFDLATKQAGHGWSLFDLTDTFADWLSQQPHSERYFAKPDFLSTLIRLYPDYLKEEFKKHLDVVKPDEQSVVALLGAGSLFGFMPVKEFVEAVAPLVKGRLVVFFPGTNENNNYRLLDAYDGWGYLAVPITAEREA